MTEAHSIESIEVRVWTIRIWQNSAGWWYASGTDQHGRKLWNGGNYLEPQKTRAKMEDHVNEAIRKTQEGDERLAFDRAARESADTYTVEAAK